ncbi:MAG: bifunctional DNA-formamidopyrimidine glycosylase/DNA-(apurinic or apyrimidinic site) lyase [Candidatus Viridilinea halotolerans]|uniref:Bifunctional DNA-formamidopyrimidine glycosylase/DNA-(Apurinic or apyrimidinic site) lyase n=1 Tax=Candidatus Viridilinea halotolerans TaxID=2491704 RepID=A0A426TQM2_9CHLR|nr:MAG: bifunctional DNA-formamidopyrimidine glycosylase/DNA-(apurinic or apyrimidinic site) lyase [Candidatus Viridilinea halotolerans]
MPELPEVEIAARSLAPQVEGRVVVAVERLDWERMVETPDAASFRLLIVGRQIQCAHRRAKWVLLDLDDAWTLAIHLRMSGNLTVQRPEVEARHHVHLILQLSDGGRIFFDDERKFGRVRLLDRSGLAHLDACHGPEPLDARFTPEVLAGILAGRQTKIKSLLLDQHRIAGLGNIYVNESLWHARLHPSLPAGRVAGQSVVDLHAAMRQVLEQAIAHEGSSLRNYRNGYGRRGQNQEHFLVYDRAGQPCLRCGCPIERLVIAQRSSFYCPACQIWG